MKLSGYSKDDILNAIKRYGNQNKAAKALGVSHTAIQKALKRHDKPIAAGCINLKEREVLKGKRFVFTSAQNNTHINKKFWASLLNFCDFRDAKLYVSRFTYNKSGFQNGIKDKEGLWYAKDIKDYVLDESVYVSDGLIFCGELDILPTAVDPLSGFESYAGYNSAILPHTKVAMKSLPRLKGELPRFLYTTGTVTQRNYIQRKEGQKAEFHHVYGALYVEIDKNGDWFVRQLIADNNGEFYDLQEKFTPTEVTEERLEAITFGDIHIEKEDPIVSKSSWGNRGSMVSVLRPAYCFVHDVTDFSARNHHNISDPYYNARYSCSKKERVEDELKLSSVFLASLSQKTKVVVVESNHHEAFERWLKLADGHRDPVNARFWHECNAKIFEAIEDKKEFDIYEWALKQFFTLPDVKFLKQDESLVIKGIEYGIHGHTGINGKRGSPSAYRSVGRRVNSGHTHSAGIIDGVYTAGVSGLLDMGYNKGLSTWSHSHIITYRNGKRAIITIKNGKWKA